MNITQQLEIFYSILMSMVRKLFTFSYVLSVVGIISFSVIFFSSKEVHAISSSVYTSPTALDSTNLTASDSTPRPFESETLTLTSYSTDLTRAAITWTINGKKVASGIDDTTYTMTMGDIGSVANINVSVVGYDGTTVDQTMILKPATVTMLWQANSYTPPFYKGKALLPNQGDVTIVAIPQFDTAGLSVTNPKDFIYTWDKGDMLIQGASGYGRDSVTIPGELVQSSFTINVVVSTIDGTSVGSGSIDIDYGQPKLTLYKYSPLYGTLYNQALQSSYTLTDSDLTVEAVPYYFSTPYPHSMSPLSFSWQVNGTQASAQAGNSLTVKPPANVSGQSILSVSASNADKLLQLSTASVNVNFGSGQ